MGEVIAFRPRRIATAALPSWCGPVEAPKYNAYMRRVMWNQLSREARLDLIARLRAFPKDFDMCGLTFQPYFICEGVRYNVDDYHDAVRAKGEVLAR